MRPIHEHEITHEANLRETDARRFLSLALLFIALLATLSCALSLGDPAPRTAPAAGLMASASLFLWIGLERGAPQAEP